MLTSHEVLERYRHTLWCPVCRSGAAITGEESRIDPEDSIGLPACLVVSFKCCYRGGCGLAYTIAVTVMSDDEIEKHNPNKRGTD